MKKIIIIVGIIILVLSIYKQEKLIIPKESIRFRIIANSNTLKDQNLKKEILSTLTSEIEKIEDNKTIEDTRNYIKNNLSTIESIIKNKLNGDNNNTNFRLEYGNNYFPKKEYNNVVYEEGEYESLVITLGKGNGDNFWCVLFPPICLVDEEEVEYKSIIKEIIDKYFPL